MKIIITLILLLSATNLFSQPIHHELYVKLNLDESKLEVQDSISIPNSAFNDDGYLFVTTNKKLLTGLSSNDYLSHHFNPPNDNPEYEFKIKWGHEPRDYYPLKVAYSGIIKDEIKAGAAEYARGFSETSGTISKDGVYLAGSTYWIPSFGKNQITFKMTVELPKEWGVVSQGKRTSDVTNDSTRIITYECYDPMDEIYLIALPWTEYEQKVNNIDVQVFLREADEALAQRYLGVTKHYLDLYNSLIGKYPYSKFTVVENFWETGYGMPSFTLLGSKVIRFPFILHSSYPHELLHNWWGNSVYVDYETGNWCEGITVYMADHLIKEQQGKGISYRRTSLQKYANHVTMRNDFPITQFRSRNNSAEAAIGYGKVMMMNHMLRKLVGDEAFINAYARFYNDYKFKYAGFKDIQKTFEATTNTKLDWFFKQWVEQTGAPEIKIGNIINQEIDGSYQVTFDITQAGMGEAYKFDLPIAYYIDDADEVIYDLIKIEGPYTQVKRIFQDKPVKFTVDPRYDIFRKLDKLEVPTTISTAFGSEMGMIILPKASKFLKEYEAMADMFIESQMAQGKLMAKAYDSDLDSNFDAELIWIIGYENKFANLIDVEKAYDKLISSDDISKIKSIRKKGALIYCAPNPQNAEQIICFIGSKIKQAIPAITRKLPHYGKYSYLGFEGGEAKNVLKGEFPVLNSPMTHEFLYDGEALETELMIAPSSALVK